MTSPLTLPTLFTSHTNLRGRCKLPRFQKGVNVMSNGDIAHKIFPPCCPDLERSDNCDVLDYHYRQLYPVTVRDRPITVEVTIHVRLTRCTGPLTLGDLVYSTTLFPGEKVRLFTSDRRTRFTFDSSSNVSYRNEQTQE